MDRYEVLYHDRHTEIVDEDTVNDLIDELELFDRTDVSQIHQLNDDDSLGDTIWTEEEGLFPTDFFAKYYGDYDDYTDDVLDVSASEVDDIARDVLGDTEFEIAFDEDDNTVGTNVKTLVVDIISSEYPDIDLGSVPDRVISALENMIEEGYLTEAAGEELSKTTLKEAVSPTYMTAYKRLAKKFDAVIAEADTDWIVNLIEAGLDDDYYTLRVANTLRATAEKNIDNGMREVDATDLCHTGVASVDSVFEQFMEEESENFDSRFDFNNMLYLCYTSGDYEYFDSYEDSFTGNMDTIECVIGVDYASGASIAWIRGEDDIEDLESLLDI